MAKLPRVTLRRSGNRLVVDPSTPTINDIVKPLLRYVEKRHYHGEERALRKRARRPLFDEIEWECFSADVKGRTATSFGFEGLIREALTEKGFEVRTRWATKAEAERAAERDATVYRPQWDKIEEFVKTGFEFRHRQKRALRLIAEHPNGRIDCHTGWGKGTLIALAAMLFPRAKIDVVVKPIAVLKTRLYPELCLNLPSVGIIGGGKRITGQRVMCVSADSLHHGRPDADFVFVDEGHQACADKYAEKLGIYEHARMWSFSASWEKRLDNKNLRGTAMFGPIRLRVTYQTGVEKGIVVPIRVIWRDVIMDENPCADEETLDGKKRAAYWLNDYRNRLVAADARLYGPEVQTLITVETLEHALNLKRFLPHFKIVYSDRVLKPADLKYFRAHYAEQFRPMTSERRARLTQRFEKGLLKKVIATPVWNVGVDFRHLEVLIRADGGGSPINDIQIPGRNSRKKRAEDVAAGAAEKVVGILHDYRDQFDSGCRGKAARRENSYDEQGWEQVRPDPAQRSALRRRMNMGL